MNNNDQHNYSKHLIYGQVTATKGASSAKSLYQLYGISASHADMVRHIYQEFKFKVWWYTVFILAGLICLFTIDGAWFNVLELFVCMVAIDLVGRANVWGQVAQIAECLLYGYISFINGLYGEAIKSLVINLGITIFSLVSWLSNMKKGTKKTISIKKLSDRGWLITAVSFVGVFVAAYFGLGALNTNALIISAITFALSIIFKTLTALCFKESWFMGILQSSVNLCLWGYMMISGLFTGGGINLVTLPILFVYLAVLSNAIYSYILWKAMYRRETVNGAKYFAKRKIKINRIAKLRKRYKTLRWNKEIDMAKNS